MLIPRFSIRRLLLVTAACSLLGPVLAAAARGHFWAQGVVVGLVVAVVFLSVHAAMFLLFLVVGRGSRAWRAGWGRPDRGSES